MILSYSIWAEASQKGSVGRDNCYLGPIYMGHPFLSVTVGSLSHVQYTYWPPEGAVTKTSVPGRLLCILLRRFWSQIYNVSHYILFIVTLSLQYSADHIIISYSLLLSLQYSADLGLQVELQVPACSNDGTKSCSAICRFLLLVYPKITSSDTLTELQIPAKFNGAATELLIQTL